MTAKEMFDRADAYFNDRNYEKCIYTCDKLIEKGYNAYDLRGNCFFELQMYGEAIIDYSIVIDRDKADIYIYGQRGSSYFSINDFDNALKDFSFAINQFGLDGKAKEKYSLKNQELDTQLLFQTYGMRANLNYQMKKYSESLQDCEKCLQLMENFGIGDSWSNANIYLTKGNALRGMMQWEYAECEYTKALSYDNKNPQAYYGRFMVRHMLQDSLNGLEDLENCVKYSNVNSKIYQEASSMLNDIKKRMEEML
jgi:tetratricopeptide (TPR) repeat protein